jgi:septum formation protein
VASDFPVRLVLASASPRRRRLVATFGIPFDVVPSDLVETVPAGLGPEAAVAHLALAKAHAVAAGRPPGAERAVVLGADTLVVLDGRPLGKPGSSGEARAMLAALAGRAHEVMTGVALVEAPPGRVATATVVSRVVMKAYSSAEIAVYAATAEPYDKAGGYAVQGEGGRLVARVEGCYSNVVGLPLTTTARLLRDFGYPVAAPPVTAPEGWDPAGPAPA